MKTSFRELINVAMLNDGEEWVNFLGDSEYYDEDKNLVMGYWNFLSVRDEVQDDEYFNLDDCINVKKELTDGYDCFKIKNDNGKICTIRLIYEV